MTQTPPTDECRQAKTWTTSEMEAAKLLNIRRTDTSRDPIKEVRDAGDRIIELADRIRADRKLAGIASSRAQSPSEQAGWRGMESCPRDMQVLFFWICMPGNVPAYAVGIYDGKKYRDPQDDEDTEYRKPDYWQTLPPQPERAE